MKALFTSFCLTFFFITTAFSSPVPASDSLETYRFDSYPSAGIRGGVNISSLTNFNRNDSRLGMHVGLFGEYRISPLLGISTELSYTQQGTILDNLEFGMNYLNMPLMLTLHDNDFTVQGGVYGAVLLKGKAIYGKFTEDVTDQFKQTETGICLGVSYDFFSRTFIGLRFYHGLQNVNKSINDSRLVLRSNTLQISGGYTF